MPNPMGDTPNPAPIGDTPNPAPIGDTPNPAPIGDTPNPAPIGDTPNPAPIGDTPNPGPILVLSGPNLNLLGEREPEIYGKATLDDHVDQARRAANGAGYEVEHLQSNHEGDLIDAIHRARGRAAAIVFNPGAFTHYAHALADALAAYDGVVVEVHLSNPMAREAWRRTSVIAPVATGTIAGFGGTGYRLAVEAAIAILEERA